MNVKVSYQRCQQFLSKLSISPVSGNSSYLHAYCTLPAKLNLSQELLTQNVVKCLQMTFARAATYLLQ